MNLRSIIKKFSDSRWDIGIITTPLDDILEGKEYTVKWIKHDFRDSWFADPFIINITEDSLILLVEEFYKPIYRGRIAKLVVDRESLKVKNKEVVLELNTHLSFPAFFKEGDNLYIYPENGESGKLTLYTYDIRENSCSKNTVICRHPVEDAVITNLFGYKLLFATSRPNPNGNILEIYKWDELKNLFVLSQTHEFNENIARMSGRFFKHNERVYRPTQECNIQYGHAVTLQEVTQDNHSNFKFVEIRRLYSQHPRFKTGMHTFNVYKDGFIATDALTFDNMWFRKLLMSLHILPRR